MPGSPDGLTDGQSLLWSCILQLKMQFYEFPNVLLSSGLHFLKFSYYYRVMDRWTDQRTDGRTDGQMDKASYRDAWTHLKRTSSLVSCQCHVSIYFFCPDIALKESGEQRANFWRQLIISNIVSKDLLLDSPSQSPWVTLGSKKSK